MPRSRKPTQEPVSNEPSGTVRAIQSFACSDDAKWGGFINRRLTDDEADDFHDWVQSAQIESGWVLLDVALRAGVKLSVTYDVENNTFIATFTGDLLHIGDRRAITSRAPSWSHAVLLAVFKHVVLLRADYSSCVSEKPKWNTFG